MSAEEHVVSAAQDWPANARLRRFAAMFVLIAMVGLVAGLLAYLLQAAKNHEDADERFGALSQRVTHGVVERLRRYEYGLRGARGVVVATDGTVTREAFARYAASRQVDREFPGARGFGIIYRVSPADEAAFVKARRSGDSPDFAIRQMAPHAGDRFVITYVEPGERNREAIGLDIASEQARRDAALLAARRMEATLTAPITLVQASGKQSGGLLLLLPIQRQTDAGRPVELIGWSYAPLLIEEILKGIDAEEEYFALSLFDLDKDARTSFFATGREAELALDLDQQRIDIPLYGRRWEAQLRPTKAFVRSLHQASPWGEAIKAALLGAFFAALLATGAQLIDRTRGQRLEQARRAAIVEGSSDAIVVQTLDGTITDWNDGATRLFGFTRDEANGRTATDLLLPPELAGEDESIRSTVARGERVRVFETWRRSRDGAAIAVSITASPIHDSDGVVVGSAKILRDVRESKAAEQRMLELNASLEDQVRERTAMLDEAMRQAREANEAKSRFLANISHEIRTPMNAVLGLSHLLERTRLDEDQAAMLSSVRMAGKTLMALLNDVLDFSKIEAGEMSLEAIPFRLDDVIEEVTSLMGVSAQDRGVTFSVSTHGAIDGMLIGDSTRVAQILLNLLSNAIKFSPRGRVELAVHIGRLDGAGLVPISFVVLDSGIGIPLDVQQRLFQPFVQADASTTRKFGGTGLGLSIVRQLVHLLGGEIELRSAPGQGSTFKVDICLPLAARSDSSASPHMASKGLGMPLSEVHVLVVDDNALNREVAERILRSEGASVTLAPDGQQALDLLRQGGSTFDAVLMDVQMPVMDGLTATQRIRELYPREELPVIGLTAGVSSEERRAGMNAGMNAVVGKPFDPALLVATIATQLGRMPEQHTAGAIDGESAQLPSDWPDVCGLDPHLSFRNLKGDHEIFRRMLAALKEALECMDQVLAEESLQGSQGVLTRTLHDLKAIAGTLGATELQAAARQAEQLCRAGNLDAVRAAISYMKHAGQRTVEAANDLPPLRSAERAVAALSQRDQDAALAVLLGQLRNNDLAAISTSKTHAATLLAVLGEGPASQVAEMVLSLDFAGATRVIQSHVR